MNYFINKGGLHYTTHDTKTVRDEPLSPIEFAVTLPNAGIPSDTDNAVGTGVLNLADYGDLFTKLKVGDAIFVELYPDALLYRGLWAVTSGSLGVKFDVELVDANDVWIDFCKKENIADTKALGDKLEFDMEKCIGYAAEQAIASGSDCKDWVKWRNTTDALQSKLFPMAKQFVAQIGHPVYVRLKVTSLDENYQKDMMCMDCDMPCIQIGAIIDNLCVIKGFVNPACKTCQAACDDDDCNECP